MYEIINIIIIIIIITIVIITLKLTKEECVCLTYFYSICYKSESLLHTKSMHGQAMLPWALM